MNLKRISIPSFLIFALLFFIPPQEASAGIMRMFECDVEVSHEEPTQMRCDRSAAGAHIQSLSRAAVFITPSEGKLYCGSQEIETGKGIEASPSNALSGEWPSAVLYCIAEGGSDITTSVSEVLGSGTFTFTPINIAGSFEISGGSVDQGDPGSPSEPWPFRLAGDDGWLDFVDVFVTLEDSESPGDRVPWIAFPTMGTKAPLVLTARGTGGEPEAPDITEVDGVYTLSSALVFEDGESGDAMTLQGRVIEEGEGEEIFVRREVFVHDGEVVETLHDILSEMIMDRFKCITMDTGSAKFIAEHDGDSHYEFSEGKWEVCIFGEPVEMLQVTDDTETMDGTGLHGTRTRTNGCRTVIIEEGQGEQWYSFRSSSGHGQVWITACEF